MSRDTATAPWAVSRVSGPSASTPAHVAHPAAASTPSALRTRFAAFLDGSGIALDGANPWDIQVRDERFFTRVLRQGSLGLGEAYMDGWWDCDRLDELFCRALRAGLQPRIRHPPMPGWLEGLFASPG